MQIPNDMIEIYSSRRAVTYNTDVAVVVNHTSRDCTEVTTFDMETGRRCDWGMHRTPADALRFVEAFMSLSGENHKRDKGSPLSDRYSAAVSIAYSRKTA